MMISMTGTNIVPGNLKPQVSTEKLIGPISNGDLQDLCDSTLSAIEAGGGFGWVNPPHRDILERYWQGVLAMPVRTLLAVRLDHVICGSLQLVKPPKNNEAQSFACQLTGAFVAPWARGHGCARALMLTAEKEASAQGFSVINLDVRETQNAAIKLYEEMGYQLIGTHPAYARVNGEVVPGRYYYKTL